FRDGGLKCWLVNTSRSPSRSLRAYLKSVPKEKYQTSTCLNRDTWWAFRLPAAPHLLVASGFREQRPKALINAVGARAVGAVCGIYGMEIRDRLRLVNHLRSLRLNDRVVAHSQ